MRTTLHTHLYAQAAEAMGAISSAFSLPILRKYLNDSNRSVRETCEIALAKIEWDNSEEGQRHHASALTEPQSAVVPLTLSGIPSLTWCPSERTPPSTLRPRLLAFLQAGRGL